MNNLGDFFKKIITSISLSEQLDKEIISSIQEQTGVAITKEEFNVKDTTLILSIHPALKQEIFLKKEQIISSINSNFPGKITNVR